MAQLDPAASLGKPSLLERCPQELFELILRAAVEVPWYLIMQRYNTLDLMMLSLLSRPITNTAQKLLHENLYFDHVKESERWIAARKLGGNSAFTVKSLYIRNLKNVNFQRLMEACPARGMTDFDYGWGSSSSIIFYSPELQGSSNSSRVEVIQARPKFPKKC